MSKKERIQCKKNKLVNNLCKPIYNVGLILKTFIDYLQEHRELYDNKEAYLKTYLKGRLTHVINRTKDFINYNYIGENIGNVQAVKNVIEDNFAEELNLDKEIKEEFFEKESEINQKLFKTYVCALVCVSTIYDMFMKKENNPLYNDFKKKLKDIFLEFKIYDDFWQNEVQKINVIMM